MINLNELKPNNLLTDPAHNNQIVILLRINIHDGNDGRVDEGGYAYDVDLRTLEPIPLTPEVLKKCGLMDKVGNGAAYRMDVNSQDEICWYMDDGFLRYQTQMSGFTRQLQHIKYLHQLQNWWHSFTGKELNISI